jgi:hypothetical protein
MVLPVTDFESLLGCPNSSNNVHFPSKTWYSETLPSGLSERRRAVVALFPVLARSGLLWTTSSSPF